MFRILTYLIHKILIRQEKQSEGGTAILFLCGCQSNISQDFVWDTISTSFIQKCRIIGLKAAFQRKYNPKNNNLIKIP